MSFPIVIIIFNANSNLKTVSSSLVYVFITIAYIGFITACSATVFLFQSMDKLQLTGQNLGRVFLL